MNIRINDMHRASSLFKGLKGISQPTIWRACPRQTQFAALPLAQRLKRAPDYATHLYRQYPACHQSNFE
jgi:hypothetical protein